MSCADKNKHRTERDALDHLAWARKQRHQEGSKSLRTLHVYRCDWCGFWHIGHDVGRFTTPVPSAAKLRRKVEAVGAQIAADDRRWMQEQTRRAEQEARHREEMAEQARDHAEVLAEIERLVDEDLRQRKAGK